MPFLSEEIAAAYESAPRFDEGHFYQEPEYMQLSAKRAELCEKLCMEMSPEQGALFQEVMELECDINEEECRHFFEQGLFFGNASFRTDG